MRAGSGSAIHEQEEDGDEMMLAKGYIDVAVLIEDELGGVAARLLVDMYQLKGMRPRYNLVRPLSAASRADADRLLEQSIERLQALKANATGVVSHLEPVDALSGLATATGSTEVVVVAERRRLAALLRRDLPSQVRARLRLPLVHLVSS